MIQAVLLWATGALFVAIYAFVLVAIWWRARKPPTDPCPHGFQDWDECPVCCH